MIKPFDPHQRGSTFLGVVERRWPTPVPREDIHTKESGLMQADRSPLP